MSEMVDRVARAIRPALYFDAPTELSRVAACAVIKAMRYPTQAMVYAVKSKSHTPEADAMDVWMTMIDAALEEEKTS